MRQMTPQVIRPACSPDGRAYFGVLASEEKVPTNFLLYRSADGGASWGPGIEQPTTESTVI